MLLVVLVALGLFVMKIGFDDPEGRWLSLKLRFGNVEARRSAASRASQSIGEVILRDSINQFLSGTFFTPKSLETLRLRPRRRAEVLLSALTRATSDPDPVCRINALKSLAFLAVFHPSESDKLSALRRIVAATRDQEVSVRAAAVGSLARMASIDKISANQAIRSALTDPSIEVRQSAIQQLGILGMLFPESQPDAVSILIPLLGSREESRIRVKAAWALHYLGIDRRRRPSGNGPDIVSALLTALHDSDPDIRQEVARIFGSTDHDNRGRTISSWDQRKAVIIPALKAMTADDDKIVREESALALFVFGQRDLAVIELIEQGVRDAAPTQKTRFESALNDWRQEPEPQGP